MEFIRIINTIAMAIGYLVVVLAIVFWFSVLWARYLGVKEAKKWLQDELGQQPD